MTIRAHHSESVNDPEGSIFLFEPLTDVAYQKERFAMLTNRGLYRGLDHHEIEQIDAVLQFRMAVTQRIASAAITTSELI